MEKALSCVGWILSWDVSSGAALELIWDVPVPLRALLLPRVTNGIHSMALTSSGCPGQGFMIIPSLGIGLWLLLQEQQSSPAPSLGESRTQAWG